MHMKFSSSFEHIYFNSEIQLHLPSFSPFFPPPLVNAVEEVSVISGTSNQSLIN